MDITHDKAEKRTYPEGSEINVIVRVAVVRIPHSLPSYGGKKSIHSSAHPSSPAVRLGSGGSHGHGSLGLGPRARTAQAVTQPCEAAQPQP